MKPKCDLITFSGIAGFAGGACATGFLFLFYGTKGIGLMLYLPPLAVLFFPLGSALVAAVVSTIFDPNNFGSVQGVLLALSSFALLCVLFGWIQAVRLWYPGSSIVESVFMLPFTFLFFGIVLVGWIILPIGAIFGSLYKKRSNRAFKADA
ncbi:MAG: hypothetical protein ABFR19_05315 [Pseudomonadota bacterium]